MRKSIAAGVLLALAFAGSVSLANHAQAQQFSAEIVSGNAASATVGEPGRLYVANQKVRIETPELPDSFLIVDGLVPAAYLVRPRQQIFMDAKQSSRLTQLFVPLDPGDPCPRWQAMTEVAGITDHGEQWHCVAQGTETVDGRNTAKFMTMSPQGRSARWIDIQLKFPIKIETGDGGVFALRDIQEGPQSADQFEIPSNYKKFDPRKVIEHLKHSDVWVEPPR